MPVPYTFSSATSAIPLSQLDSNFATTITLGNTAIQLGNTVTTLNNMTLANVTVTTVSGASANAVVYTNSSGQVTANSSVIALDTSGNLGLGVTPSAWSGFKALQIGTGGALSNPNSLTRVDLSANWYYNGTNDIYIGTGAASLYRQNGGQHIWFQAGSGTGGTAIGFTQAMTLDASGRLGIGVTSPSCASDVQSSGNLLSRFTSTDVNGVYSTWRYNSNTVVGYIGSAKQLIGSGSPSAADFCIDASGANNLIFGVNDTERARIDSSGNLLVGTTSAAIGGVTLLRNGLGLRGDYSDTYASSISSSSTTGTQYFITFARNTSQCGSITSTASNSTTYATSSDYRLKENIQPMTGALATVAQLKPVTYTWKEDGSDGQGFIAHELQAIVPQCVVGKKDAVDADGKPVYQGVDTSFLVATLTAAIQEQQAIITQLQADVAALKGAK